MEVCMPYEEQLIEFLQKERNLRIALEIERVMPGVRKQLALAFWEAACQQLEEALQQSVLSGEWEIQRTLKDHNTDPFARNAGIQAAPKKRRSESGLTIGAWNDSQGVYSGVCFRNEYDWSQKPAELVELLGALKGVESLPEGAARSRPENDRWNLAWGWTQIKLPAEDTLKRICADSDAVAREAIGPLRDVLSANDIAARMDAADRAIAGLQNPV
jgi:hypothetical protein